MCGGGVDPLVANQLFPTVRGLRVFHTAPYTYQYLPVVISSGRLCVKDVVVGMRSVRECLWILRAVSMDRSQIKCIHVYIHTLDTLDTPRIPSAEGVWRVFQGREGKSLSTLEQCPPL